MKFRWKQRSNASTLETVVSVRELMAVVRRRQIAFLCHIVRVNGPDNLVVTGRINGTRSRGKPWKKNLDRMKEIIDGATTQQLLNMTGGREHSGSITGNVFNDTPH